MADQNSQWTSFEVWADKDLTPPYILLVIENEDRFQVLDPTEGNKIAFEAEDYEIVKNWLLEDEYDQIGNREYNK